MTPGRRNNRASNFCRELLERPFRCITRLEDGDRIEENGNAGVSRREFNHTRNRRALKQLEYSQRFVQRLFWRILKLLAHAHDQRGISEGKDFHRFSHSERSRGIPLHNLKLISRGPSTSL